MGGGGPGGDPVPYLDNPETDSQVGRGKSGQHGCPGRGGQRGGKGVEGVFDLVVCFDNSETDSQVGKGAKACSLIVYVS